MGSLSRWYRKRRRGSRVQVRYDPRDPSSNDEVRPLAVELAIVVGGIAVGVALVVFGLGGDV